MLVAQRFKVEMYAFETGGLQRLNRLYEPCLEGGRFKRNTFDSCAQPSQPHNLWVVHHHCAEKGAR